MKLLLIAEPNLSAMPGAGTLHPTFAHLVTAGSALHTGMDCWLWASEPDRLLPSLRFEQINNIFYTTDTTHPWPMAEIAVPHLQQLIQREAYTHLLMAATSSGKDILPRLGAVLDVQPITGVTSIEDDHTFVRPIYAGNALTTVQSSDAITLLTIQPTAFEKALPTEVRPEHNELPLIMPTHPHITAFHSSELVAQDRPTLAQARVVVAGGRGIGSSEGFSELAAFADKIGAAMGATRAAVDAGFAPNDWQIGQTGKTIAPDIYIAVGISGAIQHVSGIQDSGTIVAINTDKDAPIFDMADIGLVADWRQALPELLTHLS